MASKVRGQQTPSSWEPAFDRGLPLVFVTDLSTSGRRVGGRLWTSFHQPGSPNSCAPERKKAGLPTDRQPATVLHQVDVFFLQRRAQHERERQHVNDGEQNFIVCLRPTSSPAGSSSVDQ